MKFGKAAIEGQIQVPDAHSFTMSQTKKVVLDGFFTENDYDAPSSVIYNLYGLRDNSSIKINS